MSNFHKIELKSKPNAEDSISTGANTELYIDGQKFKGITAITIDLQAGGIAKVKLEMIGHVVASVIGELQTQVLNIEAKD